jgi:AraC-like DNA-binding protein
MPIWIDLSLQPLTNNDQTLFLACFFESAKHKQIEAKLHQVMGLLSLVQEFTTKDKQSEELQTTSRPSLTKVFRFIETNYRNPISLREVAHAVGYSSAYLTNLVQQETGRTVPPVDYRIPNGRGTPLVTQDQPISKSDCYGSGLSRYRAFHPSVSQTAQHDSQRMEK